MARNFLATPFAPYLGQFSSKPFQGVSGKGLMVMADVFWPAYSVAGQSLGNSNPEFNVVVDLNAAASNQVSQNWLVRSVYIDNQNVNFPVYVYFTDTQFPVSCPANAAGWFQVFTAARRAFVVGIAISNVDIENLARTRVFFTDAIVASYLDQEAQTAVNMKIASPFIALGTSGGQIATIEIIDPGLWCGNGAMTISGGGGSGGAANGNVSSLGQFDSINITNVGTGYTGPPNVVFSGGFSPPASWNVAIAYGAGVTVAYLGFVYTSILANTGVQPTGAFISATFWTPTGLSSVQRAATFRATVTATVGGASFSNSGAYGSCALGDQVKSYISDNPGGPFVLNMFGTPFANGFIYITNLSATVLQCSAGCDYSWQFEDTNGNVVVPFQWKSATVEVGKPLLSLTNCNIKLPADLTYRLTATSATGAIKLQHNFAFTYSQIG